MSRDAIKFKRNRRNFLINKAKMRGVKISCKHIKKIDSALFDIFYNGLAGFNDIFQWHYGELMYQEFVKRDWLLDKVCKDTSWTTGATFEVPLRSGNDTTHRPSTKAKDD